ncbi:DUF1028 domain-containing protein [Caulobacter mirabilis]|uniref:DUF1028 domain-containing protein n=1 Tax=Caulobacter mirabilis TaxID=69666 RepID=A0A2D2B0J1_9CAUL|nr:DUF1028 domain-containing protein [Caulobacter mirabilis]ATQ43761.1 hypothetical protein CSW64_15850 [Caulobacter mirabilis]
MLGRGFWIAAGAALAAALSPATASATFSIVACDARGVCGAAAATNNLAVGASVIHARARVGALASQFETNPAYGPRGLARLEAGQAPKAVLDELLRTDGDFDGQDLSYRQVGLVGAKGAGVAYTGVEAQASSWAGALSGETFSVQGNGLAGPRVLEAMRQAYDQSGGPLAERLMVALEAGEAAGGQTIGGLSAAILVRTPEGGWQDIDLRVDAADRPVAELRRLLNLRFANDAVIRAERLSRQGKSEQARAALVEALRLGPGWDRIQRRAARLYLGLGDHEAAVAALARFAAINPAWARIEVGDPLYTPLADDPAVKRIRAASIPSR